MKIKKSALDVDFIGGQEPLNHEEELAISNFFKQQLQAKAKKSARQINVTKSSKISI